MILHTLANRAWELFSASNARRFRRALAEIENVQTRRLRLYLQCNANTEFGRKFRFHAIRDVASYQASVPLHDYDALAPYIDRIAAGEPNVLTAEPVIRLMPSSGSSRAAKFIPYTRALQREFDAAIAPWICDLYRSDPALRDGPAYWSITPNVRVEHPSKIPIGYDDDSACLGGIASRLVNMIMAVPSDVARIADPAAARYVTVLHLLRRRDLRLISAWHPSFLSLLMREIADQWDRLLADIAHDAPARATELRNATPLSPRTIWPGLRLVSCWADANAAAGAADLAKQFDGIRLQPKGLLATEAFVTIPYADAKVLAATSHFFEFVDDAGAAHLPHRVDVGGEYTLAVTTAGGLYRYRLHDRVRVTGRMQTAPTLDFIGKTDLIVDHRGEKLNEAFVASVLRELVPDAPFRMLAPDPRDRATMSYTLYVEVASLPFTLAADLDASLCANPHYQLCRSLGQLAAPRVRRLDAGAYAVFISVLQREGQRLGNIKPLALSSRMTWSCELPGAYL